MLRNICGGKFIAPYDLILLGKIDMMCTWRLGEQETLSSI